MAQNQAFVRVYYTKHASQFNISGGIFHLHKANGQSEIAAVSITNGASQVLYHAWPSFLEKYSHIFPLGDYHAWDEKKGLTCWLNSIIYHSFVLYSNQGVERCWFVKNIPAPNAYELTGVPLGFERFFNQEPGSFWILLKNGTKVWPVRVINNNFRDHWVNFLKDHEVKPNFKVVFGCYRRWIFDVTVLNANLEQVMQSWNTTNNNNQDVSITERLMPTSCMPSTMRTSFCDKQFGCVFTNNINLAKLFEDKLNTILQDGELGSISLRTGNRAWKVPISNEKLGSCNFNKFIDDHNLAPNDFLFVGISGHGHLQIIIFARHGGERTYEWY